MTSQEAAAEAAAPQRRSWSEAAAVYLRRDVLIVLFLGFSAGLPLALTGATLLNWMSEFGVNLRTIGLFAMVGTPYTLKFLWAPLVDAIEIPFLTRRLGRRRGWLVFTQLLLMVTIAILGLQDPSVPFFVALAALFVATASATQDIVIDAYRIDRLAPDEREAGMGSYVAAYRVGMLVSTAGALYIVSGFELAGGLPKMEAWRASFFCMAGLVGVGIAASLLAREPAAPSAEPTSGGALQRVVHTARGAFVDFGSRDAALAIFLFIVLFKLCDAFAGAMTVPFVRGICFSREDYANIVKIWGFTATLLGGFFGGWYARQVSVATGLWVGAILQLASNLMFAVQAAVGVNHELLAVTMFVENFTGALGTVVFVVYVSALCTNANHTATQFAVVTSLAAIGRTYLSATAGFVAEAAGWVPFFFISSAVAIPSLILLWWLQRRGHFETLTKPTGPLAADD